MAFAKKDQVIMRIITIIQNLKKIKSTSKDI
jgi:hypothetical protein